MVIFGAKREREIKLQYFATNLQNLMIHANWMQHIANKNILIYKYWNFAWNLFWALPRGNLLIEVETNRLFQLKLNSVVGFFDSKFWLFSLFMSIFLI